MDRTVVALRKSTDESALKALAFDRLTVPAVCINASGQILAASAAFVAASGVPLGQLVGHSIFELAGPLQRRRLQRRWARYWQRCDEVPGSGLLRWPRPDGRRLTLRLRTERISVADEVVAMLVFDDISVEHEARRIRRVGAARDDALAAAESPGFLLGPERRVIAHNKSAVTILQETPGDLIGLLFDDLLDEDSAAGFRAAFESLRASTSDTVELDVGFRALVRSRRRMRMARSGDLSRSVAAAIVVVLGDPDRGAPAAADESRRQSRRLELRERLLQLAIEPRGEFAAALSRILRAAAETLDVSAASFWTHESEPGRLRCESMYLTRQRRFAHDWVGVDFPAGLGPVYLAGLRDRRSRAIDELTTCAELAGLTGHRRFSSVRALLDAPVLVDGEVRGVLSLHHDGPRRWDDDESGFVSTAALMVALAMEAAQRQQAERRIEQLAWYDTLTGLPNRNLLREILRDTVVGAAEGRRRVALMLIDLDRFKDVNDTLGHLVGDALIKSAAQLLRDMVGSRGMVGRLGGDEFIVVLNQFEHRQEVAQFAARIVQALHRTDLVPNIDTQVSASVGVALFPEHGREMSTLMKNADAAMYQAKRDGRNQFSFFNPIRYEHAAREVQLGIQLLKALHGGAAQFFVEYQPQVHMATGRVVGLEALIRWQHPAYGPLTPDRFIGAAESGGLSERITRWLIGEVCAQILRWRVRQPGFDIPIAVNIAGRELGSVSLPSIVRGALRQHEIEPSMLMLEVTERTLVKQNETNTDVMAELASIGVGLVLDDFGTGYSMLGYLKRMPIQSLKIDGSFVEGVPDDADSCAIVHAVLAVARHFRLKVIAEGIETAAQAEYMRSVGCEYAQGFYYARPLLPQTILDYIERDPPATQARSAPR